MRIVFVASFAASAATSERSLLSQRGSTPYDATSHVPRLSSGCGKTLPSGYKAGTTTSFTGTYAGVKRSWRVYVPSGYSQSAAYPVVIDHHGWTGTASGEERSSGIKAQASSQKFVAVWPQGMADNTHSGSWGSWNCVGSILSPGPDGATCTKSAGTQNYCYTSCGKCTDSPQCWWTTCDDDVTATGIGTDISGFIPSLYDRLESDLCIDTSREFATGMSNGGMMAYQDGASLGTRLAGIVPVAGSFHNGFAQAPTMGVPVMDIHGTRDTTVPANTTNGGGWYYTVVSQIFGGNAYSKGWKSANGCTGSTSHYSTPYDGTSSLYCISEGSCSGGDVVRCSWNGGHTFISVSGALAWNFMSKWAKLSHVGGGCSDGEACDRAPSQLTVDGPLAETEVPPSVFAGTSKLIPAASGHYGNPADGCLDDEEVIPLAGGHVCAPRIDSELSPEEVRTPACKFGDAFPIEDNGCPVDAAVAEQSTSWPACVAKGNTMDPYTNGEFHCALVCGPCNDANPETAECEEDAHKMCPAGAKCMLGELRAITYGICTFGISSDERIAV